MGVGVEFSAMFKVCLAPLLPLAAAALLASCRGPPIVGVPGSGNIPAVDFGRVIVGETVSAPFSVQNVTGDDLHLTGAPTLVGADATDFKVISSPLTTILENQSVAGRLAFSPEDAGTRSAQLGIPSDSAATPTITGELTGVGVAPESVTLAASPTSLAFGLIEILITRQLKVRVTNTSADPAPFLPPTIVGDGGGEYSFTIDQSGGAGHSPLKPGASLDFMVTFTPTVFGPVSPNLEIQACQRCAPLQIPLSGIGFAPGLVFDPPTLNFNVFRGETQTLSVQITNQGNATTELTGIGAGSGPFAVALESSLPTHLAHGDSLGFLVTYQPFLGEPAGNVDQGVLLPTVNEANEEVTPGILIGTVAPNCELSAPSNLSFGDTVPPNTVSKTLNILNTGTDACTVSRFTFEPGSDPAFEFEPDAPSSLLVPAGGDAGLGLIFAPANTGDASRPTATLQIQTNQLGLPTLSVALSGDTQS